MNSFFLIKAAHCSNGCGKAIRYNVPIHGYSHVQIIIPFFENEIVTKSIIQKLDFEVMFEVEQDYAEFENKESLIVEENKRVYLTLPMSKLKNKNIVRVFLKLENNMNQSRVNQSFTLYKV